MKIINPSSIIFIILFALIGCQQAKVQQKELSATATVGKDYLEKQGYKVLSYVQHQESYKITKSKIQTLPYSFYWKMPGNNAVPYIGKMVDVEKFIIKNHPLDHWECCSGIKSKGKVYAYVYVVEGKVVGGTSFPYIPKDSALVGGYWSLDGRTD
ncbi:hypothetical protein [Alkalihalobacillus sp. AL-G]|uniref:hypothetical protein n=1 Tax=Alkalihalobacillus sp. AL-G TaxID=2926399 RepID=UPI00272A0F01|nr:hypothetical protein [Alkalihalobacillus sp. AL-G]WLD94337.1 DUF4830 domain-containing protein [Alkalihalobacillus sp. AL-G]